MKLFATTLLVLSLGCSAALAEQRATKILTADMAAKILGGPVKPSILNTMDDVDMGKIWVSKARFEALSGGKSCGILVRHATDKDEAVRIFHESKATFSGVPVPGIGDEAYRVTTPSPQFNVLKGQTWVVFNAGTHQAGDNAAQEALAKEVLPKISAD